MKTNLRRSLFFFYLIFFIGTNGYAKSRSSQEALLLAQSFCENHQQTAVRSLKAAVKVDRLAYTCVTKSSTRSSDNQGYYYVFDLEANNGFIVVSGDDRAKTILGYSDSGCFPKKNQPENFRNWMALYEKELEELARFPETNKTASVQVFLPKISEFSTSLSPLLGFLKWNQDSPYNRFCPIIDSVQAPTGCVATAVAQVMKYHQWPVKGVGKKSYKASEVKDSLTADFANTTYNWSNMLDTYNGFNSNAVQDSAIATLMFHCGVALSMEYSAQSSSAYSNDIPSALSRWFGYDNHAQLYNRNYYTEAEWVRLMKLELNAAHPILYGGASIAGTGHLFVCDGYDADNLFHFNWGWNGMCNGYFELTSLNVETPGIGGGTGGFSVGQDMVLGIQKPTPGSTLVEQVYLMKPMSIDTSKQSRDSLFSITYGLGNYGGNTFTGHYGVGLYQNDSLVSLLKDFGEIELPSYYGDGNLSADSLIVPKTVPNGNYRIHSIFKTNDQLHWSIMRNKVGTPNSLVVAVESNQLTFSIPDVFPKLALKDSVRVIGSMYASKKARISISIQNSGGEYNSYLIGQLRSKSDPNVYQNLNIDPINIPTASNKTFELTGNVSLQPGDYTFELLYDLNNNQDDYLFSPLTPDSLNTIDVSVQATDSVAPQWVLTDTISLVDSSMIRGTEAIVSAKIKNIGGFSENSLLVLIYQEGVEEDFDYIGTIKVALDANEEKTVLFKKEMNLTEGHYLMKLFKSNDRYPSNFEPLKPDSLNLVRFSIQLPTDLASKATLRNIVCTSVGNDLLQVTAPDCIRSIRLWDLSGKIVEKREIEASKTIVVSLREFPKGIYLIQIITDKGLFTTTFIRK